MCPYLNRSQWWLFFLQHELWRLLNLRKMRLLCPDFSSTGRVRFATDLASWCFIPSKLPIVFNSLINERPNSVPSLQKSHGLAAAAIADASLGWGPICAGSWQLSESRVSWINATVSCLLMEFSWMSESVKTRMRTLSQYLKMGYDVFMHKHKME